MIETVMMSINKIKNNPDNPRIIKDDKFRKLVKSVVDFPKMLEVRPIVVGADMVILGGNMRYKACKEAGIKEVPVIVADQFNDEEVRQFIIKDNASGGEWDWGVLGNEWDVCELDEWGVDIVGFDVDEGELGEEFTLADGDKEPFQQITFTLADEQAKMIKAKIDYIKKHDGFSSLETYGNENSNGNALFALVTGQL